MAGAYEAAFEKFRDKYGVDYNIAREYELSRKLSSLDAFTIESTPEEKIKNSYKSMLGTAISYYLENKVRLEGGKKYDMTDVNIGEFINEFDNVMRGVLTDYAEKEGEKYEHKQYVGLSFNDVATAAWGRASGYNRPLADIWASQIRKGTLSLDSLQRITQNSTNMLDSMIESRMNYTNAVKSDLASVVMAKNTLEAAKNQRSWISWLNPFNWGPYGRENAYLKELNAKLQTYSQNNFPVENALPEEYGKSILGKALQDLKEDVSKAASISREAKSPVQQEKEQVFKEVPVIDKNAPLPVQIAQTLSHDALRDPHIDALYKIVSKYSHNKSDFKVFIGSKFNISLNSIRAHLEYIENNEMTEERAMQEMVKNIFEVFYENLPAVAQIHKGGAPSIAMVQQMTDYVMKNFSPAMKNPEKFGKYADNYFVKNADIYKELTGNSPEEWTYGATLDLLDLDPEKVKKENDAIKSEVNKEKPKQEEINNYVPEDVVYTREEIVTALNERLSGDIENYQVTINKIVSDGIEENSIFNKVQINFSKVKGGSFEPVWEAVRKYNEQFANLEVSDTEIMREMAKAVFAESYKFVKNCTVAEDKYLLTAQKLANYLMGYVSPASEDKEKYGEYADSYVLKNPDILFDALGDEVLDIRSQLENAREELKIELDEDILKEEREKFENLESKKENAEAEAQSNENDEPEADEESVVEYEEVDQYFLNDYFEEDDGIVDFLSTYSTLVKDKSGISSADLYEMLNDNLESFGGKIKNYNKLFNESLKGEVKLNNRKVSSEEIMQEMTLDVFKGLYGNIAKLAGKNNITAAIIATQLLTDYILDGCSPAKENVSLEKYVNNYLLKNEDILTKAMGVKKINPDVLHDARKKLNAFPKVEKQEDISNEVEDEIEVQNEVEESKVDYNPVDLDEMEEKFGDEDELEDFLWDVAREISISEDVNEKDVLQNSDLIEKIRGYNQLFNKALKEDIKIDGRKISCDDIMRKMTMDIFKTIYGEVIKAAGDSNWDRIRDAQCATDTVLELMSPLKTNRDAFEKYADNYLIKNESILAKAMGVEKVDPDILQDVRNDRKAFPDGKEEVDNLGDILPKADGPVRENLGLKLEDLENSALVNNVNDRVSSAPEKKLNNLAK